MIKINLLSPSDRLNVKWEKINHLIASNFLILIIGQLILVLIFLASIKYLDVESNGLNKQLENIQVQSEAKEVEEIKTSIEEYDKQFKITLELQKDRPAFTEVLEEFSEIVFTGVRISSIDVKPKVNKIVSRSKRNDEKTNDADNAGKFDFNIIGTTENREDLLKFENSLRNSEIFVDLIIDLSNYDNKNNDFKYSMTVDMG
ncbi:hypothetical protein KAI56_00780 [Candidatus Parcubacteria bacterium]|nr:hypothetical protein [Candidatus Parcubacteria bacterium]